MPLLDEPERYSKLLTSLKARTTEKDQNITYIRKLSPFDCSTYIHELISDFGEENLALQALPIKKDMFENFKRLQKIPLEYQRSIVWNKTSDIGVSFSVAANISKLDNPDDQKYLFQATLDHKFSKDETDHIVRLKRASQDTPIEECVLQVKKFRPVVVPTYYVVLHLSDQIREKFSNLVKTTEKKMNEIIKDLIDKKLEHKTKSLVIKDNKLALNLDEITYRKFESIRNQSKVDDYSILPYLLGEKN